MSRPRRRWWALLAVVLLAAAVSTQPAASQDPDKAVGSVELSSTTPGELVVAWDEPDSAPDDYRVMWAESTGSWPSWKDSDGNAYPDTTSYTITGLEPGVSYKVKVRARYGGQAAGPWSGRADMEVATVAADVPSQDDHDDHDRRDRSAEGDPGSVPKSDTERIEFVPPKGGPSTRNSIGTANASEISFTSNLDQPASERFSLGAAPSEPAAQKFGTGDKDITLRGVELDFESISTVAADEIVVSIRAEHPDNQHLPADTALYTLETPTTLTSGGIHTFTVPAGTDAVLDSHSDYFVHIAVTDPDGEYVELENTESGDDTGEPFWYIADDLRHIDSDGYWTKVRGAIRLAVTGTYRETSLVTNRDQTDTSFGLNFSPVNRAFMASFTTGHSGAKLTGVTLDLRVAPSSTTTEDVTVAIHSVSGGNPADPPLVTLVTPDLSTTGEKTFRVPGRSLTLERNTTYAVVISATGTNDTTWRSTNSTRQSGEPAWTIADGHVVFAVGSWRDASGTEQLRMTLNGSIDRANCNPRTEYPFIHPPGPPISIVRLPYQVRYDKDRRRLREGHEITIELRRDSGHEHDVFLTVEVVPGPGQPKLVRHALQGDRGPKRLRSRQTALRSGSVHEARQRMPLHGTGLREPIRDPIRQPRPDQAAHDPRDPGQQGRGPGGIHRQDPRTRRQPQRGIHHHQMTGRPRPAHERRPRHGGGQGLGMRYPVRGTV